ncbi:MAG: insulinase family protein [Nannocystaceae bacterium]
MSRPLSTRTPLVRAWLRGVGLVAAVALAGSPAAARGEAAKPAAAASAWRTFAGDPIAVKERRLANGLTVLISENHEVPRVFGAVVVKAGGKDDPAAATGIAHYLEHMLFKGTKALGTADFERERPHLERIEALYEGLRDADDEGRAEILAAIDDAAQEAGSAAIPGELDRVLQELGSTRVNAFTTPDITVYYNELPARSLPGWLLVYGRRFVDPVFRLFPSELEAVYEEKNRSMDGFDPIADAFLAAFFPGHPYGTKTILGSVDHLKRPSIKAMYAFYRRHYRADNMALVLAGDVDAEAIWPLIEANFGDWEGRYAEEGGAAPVEPFKGRERATVRMTPVRAVGLGFRLPPEGTPDYAGVLVCNELLTNAQGVGLLDRLGREGKVLLAQAVPIPLNDYGVGLIAAVPRLLSQSFAGAERQLRGALATLRRGAVAEATVAAARTAVLGRYAQKWESNEDRVLELVATFGRGQAWSATVDTLRRLERIDRAEVARVAERYYGDDHLAFRSRVGFPKKTRLEKPRLRPIRPAQGARSELARRVREAPQLDVPANFVDVDAAIGERLVAPGVVLRTNANPFNDLYTLELRYGIGRAAIPDLAVLGDYLVDAGSAARGADAFKEALFALATTLEIEATEERLVVRLAGPERNLGEALALVDELLRAPAERRDVLRRVRRQRFGKALVDRRQPHIIADALREHVTFGAASKYRRGGGPSGMRGLSPKALTRALARAREHAVEVRFVGTLSGEAVAEALRARVRFAATPRPAAPTVIRPREAYGEDRVFVVERRQSVQTHVYVVVEGGAMRGDLRPAAKAYSEFMGGGMGGLIFQEIRELRALAYSARGVYYEGRRPGAPGVFVAYLATQGDKTDDALDVLVDMIKALPERPERMDYLRSSLLLTESAARPGFRELQETVADWRRRGFTDDPRRTLIPAYERLEFDDLRRFHAAHIAGRPLTIMIVGDPRRFDVAALERFGPVERVALRDLFAP